MSETTAKDSTFTTTKQDQFLGEKSKHSTQTSFLKAMASMTKVDLKYDKDHYVCDLKHPLVHLNRFHPSNHKIANAKTPKWIAKCAQCHNNVKGSEWYHRCNQCGEDYCTKCTSKKQEDAGSEDQVLVQNGMQRFQDSKNDKLMFVNERSTVPKLRKSLSSVIIGKQTGKPLKKDRIKELVAGDEKDASVQFQQKKKAKKPPKIPDIRKQLNIYLNMDPYWQQYRTHASSTPDLNLPLTDLGSQTNTIDQKPFIYFNTDSSSNFASTAQLEAKLPTILNLHTQSSSITTLPSVPKLEKPDSIEITQSNPNNLLLQRISSRSYHQRAESTMNRSNSLLHNKSVRSRTPQVLEARQRGKFYGKGSLLEIEMKALKVKLKNQRDLLQHRKDALTLLKRQSNH